MSLTPIFWNLICRVRRPKKAQTKYRQSHSDAPGFLKSLCKKNTYFVAKLSNIIYQNFCYRTI
jgi:hypothetical protein